MVTSVNFMSIVIGATFLYLVNVLTHFGLLGDQWSAAMNKDKGDAHWWTRRSNTHPRIFDQALEYSLYAVQTFFIMGMMNLADVECYSHAFQLGIFFFIAYMVPDIYRSWIWEDRPCRLLAVKSIQGLLSTAGLTTLLHHFGTVIF
ncbi:hypothetical protein LRAMOSA02815 [Lichtheimia ramosa]|uniref:Uncharacterized protein n=1 Tax=Lichtheimia ramosa TaxID=688394 RepID=A0A077WST8_9FUNG|nr:hypothetical protein LRAMOSA02815 [Lichtheimia ramosa]